MDGTGAKASNPGCPRPKAVLVSLCVNLCVVLLALALLVTRVRLADHHDVSIAADDAAVVTDGLDTGLDLHVLFLVLAVFVLSVCRETLLSSAFLAYYGTTCSGK